MSAGLLFHSPNPRTKRACAILTLDLTAPLLTPSLLPCPHAGKANGVAGGAGSSACVDCASGRYSAASSAHDCTACAAGRYQPASSSLACFACPAGNYCGAAGLAEPSGACAPGTSSGGSGAAACGVCSAGTYEPAAGASTCTGVCPAGKYVFIACFGCMCRGVLKGAAQFQASEILTFAYTLQHDDVPLTVRVFDCLFSFTSRHLDVFGQTCRYSGGGAVSCTSCGAGRFSGSTGSGSCVACGSGQFQVHLLLVEGLVESVKRKCALCQKECQKKGTE